MTQEEKGLREELGRVTDKMQNILDKAEDEGRNSLKASENKEFEKLDKQAKQIRKDLRNLGVDISGNGQPASANNGNIAMNVYRNQLNGGQTGSGRPLDKDGKVRVYNSTDSLRNEHQPKGDESEVDLGSYLRAVVKGPQSDAERLAIQNSVTSGNYELPVHIGAELIDRLRAVNPLLMQGGAGARTIELEGGETKFIKTDSDPNAIWHSEMTEETPSDPSFSSVTMDPNTVMSLTEIGRELLQDSQNVEEALTNAFVGSLNDAILTATFAGATTNGPTGLASTVTQTETYSNGGSPDWTNFVAASRTLHDNNVPDGNRSFIHAPDVWENLALITDSNGRYQSAPQFIRDVPNFTTSGVSTGEAYVGDFSNVVYGFRLNITIEQFRSAAAKKYGSLWVAAARLDIATFRPNALVRIEEAAA